MASPPHSPSHNRQGASRTTGGILRGRAHGNVFNFGDSGDFQPTESIVGKVYLYDSRVDPTGSKPKSAFKLRVTTSLGTVLSKLAEKDSPVSRELLNLLFAIYVLKIWLGLDARIFTYEDNLWNIKGRYSTAINDEDPIAWSLINGDYVLPISIVSILYSSFFIQHLT